MKSPPMMFQSPSLRGSGRFEGKVRVSIRSVTRFNPLHCGAVVASPQREAARGKEETWFQSPSLRGSGRFVTQPPWHTQSHGSCFNPLHCGAVVASERRARDAERRAAVSIPFIAGQWSLREAEARAGGQGKRFNPLHCGAVVASGKVRAGSARTEKVSIPFIAGQWSLQRLRNIVEQDPRVSIPFIAGQWSLRAGAREGQAPRKSGFNPLHCGAVVASCSASDSSRPPRGVSIPFIAGQWSLQGGANNGSAERPMFQSPSLRGSGRFFKALTQSMMSNLGFNPLHCGAVVASRSVRSGKRRHGRKFQSPSLRGSGRFKETEHVEPSATVRFNPLYCGAVVASQARQLHTVGDDSLFQSPSLRGSGRFQMNHCLRCLEQ